VTGLNLEPFLRLLRADLGVWISLAAIVFVLGLMAWTSWGSRRALRKCLVLSIVAHVGLLLYGGRLNPAGAGDGDDESNRDRIQSIRIVGEDGAELTDAKDGVGAGSIPAWDRPSDLTSVNDSPLRAAAPKPVELAAPTRSVVPDRLAAPSISPPSLELSASAVPDSSPDPEPASDTIAAAPARLDEMPADDRDEITAPVVTETAPIRVRPDRPAPVAPPRSTRTTMIGTPTIPTSEVAAPPPSVPTDDVVASAPAGRPSPDREGDAVAIAPAPAPTTVSPTDDLRPRARPAAGGMAGRPRVGLEPLLIARSTSRGNLGANAPLPAPPNRPVADVPEIYRERVDPERSNRARLAGATTESEQAVERALDWLARHQDADGRWNGGTKKYRTDDSLVPGEVNFTMHCPPGEVCSGECYYHEADTAMTGLSLLAYLGAGYTHLPAEGKHAATVAKGLQFLLRTQAADGDLRGESRAVGMYCHAMATLAVCEAYGLSGDERLRDPAARAVRFLAQSRAADGLSWRYKPGEATGDTSLLGWAVLVFKAADEVGLTTPASMRAGALGWLNLVSAGPKRGLAVYRPNEGPYGGAANYLAGRNMTPTMTAEAWACRQFLGVGGPSAASDEAAAYLKVNQPDRAKVNLYYWYYGTLAMHRRGGADWDDWNVQVRDALVSLQKTSGHQSGSWDPLDSRSTYDARGGRIYCTALAAMTLEVYYRYGPSEDAKPPKMAPRPDPTIRRSARP